MKISKLFIAAAASILPAVSFAQSTFEEGGVMYMEDLTDPSKMAVMVAMKWNPATMQSMYNGDIIIPTSIEHDLDTYEVVGIGMGAFVGCPNLKSLTIEPPITAMTMGVIMADNLVSLKLPNTLQVISQGAVNTPNAESIDFGNSLKSISTAFVTLTKLQELTLPQSMESIDYSFTMCDALKSINIPGGNLAKLYSCFGQTPALETLSIEGKNLTIEYCFSQAPKLQKLTLKGVASIKDSFRECNIDKLAIPEGVTEISNSFDTFNGTELTLPNSLTLFDNSFRDCPNIKTVKLGKGVCSLGKFHQGKGETIYCPWDEVPEPPYFKSDANASVTFVVPKGMEEKYREAWANKLQYTKEQVTFREEKF